MTRIKNKIVHPILEFKQVKLVKPYMEINTQKKNRSRIKWQQRWKSILQVNEKCCVQ